MCPKAKIEEQKNSENLIPLAALPSLLVYSTSLLEVRPGGRPGWPPSPRRDGRFFTGTFLVAAHDGRKVEGRVRAPYGRSYTISNLISRTA